MKSIASRAAELALKTEGAYSFDRYSSWPYVAERLLRFGCTDLQAEAIMLSKWTRWAADASGQRYGHVTAQALIRFVAKQGKDEIAKLTVETFGVEK